MAGRRPRLREGGKTDTALHVTLPSEPASAGRARRFVMDAVHDLGAPDQAELAVLLVSELVTNAVLHARSGLDVRVTTDQGRLRVEVHDGSPMPPTQRHYGPEATTGRGIELVEALAAAWGSISLPKGKIVWFELADAA